MKYLIILFILFPAFTFAQQNFDTLKVSEAVYNCIDEVYKETDGMLLLIQRLMNDEEAMKKLHKEISMDPEKVKIIREFVEKSKRIIDENKSSSGYLIKEE